MGVRLALKERGKGEHNQMVWVDIEEDTQKWSEMGVNQKRT